MRKHRLRLTRLAVVMTLGALFDGLVASDAGAEAPVGYDASTRTLILSVNTGDGPDGNHAYEVRRRAVDLFTPEFQVSELAGSANDGLLATTACRGSVVTMLAADGSVVVLTLEQGASSAGQRESRRTLTFARA